MSSVGVYTPPLLQMGETNRQKKITKEEGMYKHVLLLGGGGGGGGGLIGSFDLT